MKNSESRAVDGFLERGRAILRGRGLTNTTRSDVGRVIDAYEDWRVKAAGPGRDTDDDPTKDLTEVGVGAWAVVWASCVHNPEIQRYWLRVADTGNWLALDARGVPRGLGMSEFMTSGRNNGDDWDSLLNRRLVSRGVQL